MLAAGWRYRLRFSDLGIHRRQPSNCRRNNLRRTGRGLQIEQTAIRHRHGRLHRCRRTALQLIDPALELQLAIHLDQRRHIHGTHVQVVDLHRQRHVEFDGRQLVGQVGHLALFQQLGRQGFGPTDRQFGHFVEVGVKHIQAAADTDQQAQGSLLANPSHARNVVSLVAHQGQVIDDQLGADAEFGLHPLDVIDAAGHGVDQGHQRANQLGHVLVAGGNHHRPPFARTLPGQGADHVIGLHALNAQQRVAEGTHAGVQRLDLHAQFIRHRRAMGFVLGKQLIAKGRPLGIENHRERAVRVLLAQALKHVQHALHRPGGQALGRGQRRHGVKGAVQVRRTVHQNQRGVRHAQDQPFPEGRS